jgi:hypothetical protein
MEINHAPFLQQLSALMGACGCANAAVTVVTKKTTITG